jgi:hypothetical protein
MKAELTHHIGTVHAHRIVAKVEQSGDFSAGSSINDQLQDLKLMRSQSAVSPVLKHMWLGQGHIKREFIGGSLPDCRTQIQIHGILRMYPRTPASLTWRTHLSSECMLNIRTAISGPAPRICLVASKRL